MKRSPQCAKRLHIGSVYRRQGYLRELFGLATGAELRSVRYTLTATYAPLDPALPSGHPSRQMAAITPTSQPMSFSLPGVKKSESLSAYVFCG